MSDNARNFDDVSFGRTIQQLRRELGLTQRFVASQLGIDFTYLSKLENDRGEAPGADAEELLALAGKIPAELRQRAVHDRDFAMFLRKLPGLSDDALARLYRDAGVRRPRK
jgi:transcriptional regulator with XRE-family HTH domain